MASVTVTLYVPAESPIISSVVAVLLHSKLYGAVPPVTVKSTVPSLSAHVASVATILAESIVGSVTSADAVVVQPLASVTVTLYVPAVKPIMSSVVAVLLHSKL